MSPCTTASSFSAPLSGTLRPGQIPRQSGPAPHVNFVNPLGSPPRQLEVDHEDFVLTSVRINPASNPSTPTRRRRDDQADRDVITPPRRIAPNMRTAWQADVGRKLQGSPRVTEGDLQVAMDQEFMRLCDRRRRLASELTRTERRLKDVAAASDQDIAYSTIPGGGGGATMRPRPSPAAGGPFAGKKTNLARTMSETRSTLFNKNAADSYTYLGPGSDGPPIGEIHPLWS